MTKQEAQMRFGAQAIEVIAAGMDSLVEVDTLERYMNLLRYVTAHATRQSSYTLGELQGMVNDPGFEFDQDTIEIVEHYCEEVTLLYEDEPIKCGKRRASTRCDCGWRSYSQIIPCQEGA